MKTDTISKMLKPMLGKPSIEFPYCCVCGKTTPIERHHPVRRGAGKAYDENGTELAKPTITLCGFGNNLKDSNGVEYCHGLAHANRLHFKWDEEIKWWRFALFSEPVDYLTAIETGDWRICYG